MTSFLLLSKQTPKLAEWIKAQAEIVAGDVIAHSSPHNRGDWSSDPWNMPFRSFEERDPKCFLESDKAEVKRAILAGVSDRFRKVVDGLLCSGLDTFAFDADRIDKTRERVEAVITDEDLRRRLVAFLDLCKILCTYSAPDGSVTYHSCIKHVVDQFIKGQIEGDASEYTDLNKVLMVFGASKEVAQKLASEPFEKETFGHMALRHVALLLNPIKLLGPYSGARLALDVLGGDKPRTWVVVDGQPVGMAVAMYAISRGCKVCVHLPEGVQGSWYVKEGIAHAFFEDADRVDDTERCREAAGAIMFVLPSRKN